MGIGVLSALSFHLKNGQVDRDIVKLFPKDGDSGIFLEGFLLSRKKIISV